MDLFLLSPSSRGLWCSNRVIAFIWVLTPEEFAEQRFFQELSVMLTCKATKQKKLFLICIQLVSELYVFLTKLLEQAPFEETVYSRLIHLAFLGPSLSMQLYYSMVRRFIGKSKLYAGMSRCSWRIHTGQPLKRITLNLCNGLEACREFAP